MLKKIVTGVCQRVQLIIPINQLENYSENLYQPRTNVLLSSGLIGLVRLRKKLKKLIIFESSLRAALKIAPPYSNPNLVDSSNRLKVNIHRDREAFYQ